MLKRLVVVFLVLFFSVSAQASNIAFGTLKGIKVYDYSGSKVTKLIFSDNATSQNVPGCNRIASITHSLHSPDALDQFISVALAAYMAGKKVRAHSSKDTCEMDFIALQESNF